MKKRRVLVLVREGLVPPENMEGFSEKEVAEWKTEYDVAATLRDMGHEVQALGVFDDLAPLRQAIHEWSPHIVFMLLEEFHGVATYDQAMVGYLELMRQPYTGCNPAGLLLSHDKGLAKEILSYHRIPTPKFTVFRRKRAIRLPSRVKFPIMVKSATEDASLGIAQSSIVDDMAGLEERVKFIHENVKTDAVAEEYINGRELYVGVIGNNRLDTFPVWELYLGKLPENVAPIATRKVKWDDEYRKKYAISSGPAKDLSPDLAARISKLAKRTFKALHMSGYARLDMRLTPEGKVYILEANANPNLEYGDDFAESAHSAGVGYEELLQRIMNLGIRYKAPWKG